MKKKNTKFPGFISGNDIKHKISSFTGMTAYSFNKKNNPNEYNKLLTLLPTGYTQKQSNNLEVLDFIYSGSTESQYILTIIAGRNDRHQGKETFDLDVFNIAIDDPINDNYFLFHHHHFKNSENQRTSVIIYDSIIPDQSEKKDITYSTYLTGSTYFESFEEYSEKKPEYLEIHTKSFRDIR